MEKTQIKYESGRIAVNGVVFTVHGQKLMVFLKSREKEPFKGLYELPGGLLHPAETAEETLARKLKDESGLSGLFFQQFHTFTKPDRDPRDRAISVGFIALLPYDKISDPKDYFPIDMLPLLAFDHLEIITHAANYLKRNISNQFVSQLLPKFFPLNDLQSVFEIIEQTKYDNRNFRKRIINSGAVKKAKVVQKNVKHRPATLYQFVD